MAEFLLGTARMDTGQTEDWYASQLGTNETQRVARAIEANIDMATLFAFARAPHAASLDKTTIHEVNIWTYDLRVLAILAVPLLATILVLCICWRIQSDEVVIGYDPLEIARRANEVLACSTGAATQETEGKDPESISSGGAYSALAARPPSLEGGDRVSVVGDVAETSPPRRSLSTGTDVRSEMTRVSPLDRDEYDRSETTRGVSFNQGYSAVHTRTDD